MDNVVPSELLFFCLCVCLFFFVVVTSPSRSAVWHSQTSLSGTNKPNHVEITQYPWWFTLLTLAKPPSSCPHTWKQGVTAMWLAKQLFVITSSLLMKRPLSVVLSIRGTAKALFSDLIPCFESAFMCAVANIPLNCVPGREKKTHKEICSSSPGCDKTSEEMTINSSSFF